MSYFVVGGTYKNTSFKEFEDGFKQEKHGPFNSYEDAKKLWEKISWEKHWLNIPPRDYHDIFAMLAKKLIIDICGVTIYCINVC